MVNKNDNVVLEFLERMNSKKVVVDFQSTAENICLYLLNEIEKAHLPGNVNEIKVRVYETSHDYAEESLKLK
jgi:6-pyruvoyltetrahydropterin/6-carboxytetrahydropterin synthase